MAKNLLKSVTEKVEIKHLKEIHQHLKVLGGLLNLHSTKEIHDKNERLVSILENEYFIYTKNIPTKVMK